MRLKKLIGLFTAGLMTVMMSVPAVAENYTPVAGTSCTFKKYLIMDAGDTVPDATFSFTVAAGTPISTDTSSNDEMEVLAGVVVKDPDTGKVTSPSIADVTFASGDATATAAGDNIDVARTAGDRVDGLTSGVQLESGEKYATQTATVSFTGITFPEPGIYRYIITETPNEDNAAMGIMNDNDVDRVLDVYVTDNGLGVLEVSSYVLHTNEDDVAINATMGSADVATQLLALDDKTDGFTNEYHVKDLAFKKEVAGNQASRDKYFKFTVKVEGLIDGKSYTVSLGSDGDDATLDGNADATSGTNSATITANQEQTNPASVLGSDLKTGVNFYLQHGQSIVIRGLSENATYEITEDAEDYKSIAAGVTDYNAPVKTVSTDDTKATIGAVAGSNKTVKTSFLNERSGIIPTGVLLSVGPWVLLGAVLLGGVIFFAVRSKKKYDEE